MALPRNILRDIRAGTYKPSAIGKKAREAAHRLREKPPPTPPPKQPPPTPPVDIKATVARQKHIDHHGELGYNASASRRAVYESNNIREMYEVMTMNADERDRLAGLASKAWHQLDATGDAGELEPYLKYDFLWYH